MSVPGPAELIVVFVVALLVFGPKKLPELSRQLGRGMRELRNLQHTLKGELDDMLEEDDTDDRGTKGPAPNGQRSTDDAGPEAAGTSTG